MPLGCTRALVSTEGPLLVWPRGGAFYGLGWQVPEKGRRLSLVPSQPYTFILHQDQEMMSPALG